MRLNDAFTPDPVSVDVRAGVTVGGPLLVLHWCDAGAAAFPRLAVRVGEGATVSVVEVFAGAEGPHRSLVVPVTELSAAAGASLSYVSLQILGAAAWSIARLAGGAGASSLRTFTVGLGAAYDRVRADVWVDGRGARSEILSAYLGDGTQVHDIRTLQDHAAADDERAALPGGGRRPVPLGLQRVDPGPPRGGPQRRPPDQPQPRARRGRPRRLGAQPRHPRERREVLPRLDSARSTKTSATTSSRRRRTPEVAEGLIVRGFFDAIIDRGPVPEVTPLLSARCTSVSTRRSRTGWWPVSETVVLCKIDEVPPGEAKRFDVAGRRIALVRIGDAFFAIDDECSHEDYSLAEGEVWTDECQIECPRRRQHLRLEDGRALCPLPATQPVSVYDVLVDGNAVAVVLP